MLSHTTRMLSNNHIILMTNTSTNNIRLCWLCVQTGTLKVEVGTHSVDPNCNLRTVQIEKNLRTPNCNLIKPDVNALTTRGKIIARHTQL
jgi:hypothetical protein